MSIPEPPQIREQLQPSTPLPDWLQDYQDAKNRFDQALSDIIASLGRSDGFVEHLTISKAYISLQVRRAFQASRLAEEPPIFDLSKARAARSLHRPDGDAA